MMRDPTEFRQRFADWKAGKKVYDAGKSITDDEYYSTMERVAKENWLKWGDSSEDAALTRILNANDYDYRGYYDKYPESLANADTHWTDEFKTVYHPTFSKESGYSGKKSKFNPEGLKGGSWGENDKFYPQNWLMFGTKYPNLKRPLPKYDGGENPWISKGTKVSTENSKEIVVSALPKTTVVSKQRPSIDDNLTEQQRGLAYLRHLYNVDKPLSGEDPIGEFAVEGAALGPVFKGLGWVGKQVAKPAMPYINRALKPVTNWLAAKALSNSIDNAVSKTTGLPEPMFNASLPNIPDVYHNVYYLPNDFKIKGNFVNRIMSIPEMAKYGDLYAAEKEASDFLVKDVAKRFGRNSPQNATGMTKHIYNGSSGIPSDLKIFYADYSKTPYGGMLLLNAAGVPYITVDPLWGNTSRVLTHELEHYLTALRESGINNSILQPSAEMDKQLLKDWSQLVNNAKTKEAYSDITPVGKTVALLLEDGYKFDDKPEFLSGMINRLKERAATNREIRLRISLENGNVYFEDLDKVIDGLTDDQLLDLLLTENGYSRSFFRELLNMGTTAAGGVLKNMREALKYSPAVIPFAIGVNTLQEHDKGKSIHIKPANRGKLTALKKRTGKSEAELYNDGNPAHKKMVVFARNARRWKH